MLRDVYWRQYPIDLLNDEKMAYIESLMPEGYEFAPYMFYITALKLADDNGIFDLGDGVIFARLMRIKDRSLVFKITNLMRRQKIIARLSDDDGIALCALTDWTYPDKKPRTADMRRKAVEEAILRERAKTISTKDFELEGCAGEYNAIPQSESQAGKCNDIPPAGKSGNESAPEAETAAPRRDFLCPEDDKNAKNVVKSRMDDKNGENVGDIQTDSTNIQEVQTNTHTQTQQDTDKQQFSGSGQLESPTPENCQDSISAVAEIQNSETENETEGDAAYSGETLLLAEQALSLGSGNSKESADSALFAYLTDFFVKNCKGFKPKQSAHAIHQLCAEIKGLSDAYNPPVEVAGVLCSEFKRMCDGQRAQYWKGQALLPSYMLKTRCWMELLQYAGKILATNTANNKFMAEAKKAEAEYLAEKAAISVAVRDELLKYNIDPDAPDAQRLLLIAKSREQEEKRKAAEVEAEAAEAEKVGDIF